MRTRLRPGAAAAVGLGALLLAAVLASPALAWHANVTVTARCLEGQVRVHYTVAAWERDHEATVDVSYELNGKVTELESDKHYFAPRHNQFSGHFDLPAGTTGTITFTAVAHWKGAEASTDTGSADLPPAEKCVQSTTTTTTETAVGAATSTTLGGGQLPFTGASSGPMLLAGLVLVGGGALVLFVSRNRSQTR
jgi:LPXTG-motif cell wall-anchored protein